MRKIERADLDRRQMATGDGGFNDAYVGQALPRLETNLRFFLDGTPEKMINVVEH